MPGNSASPGLRGVSGGGCRHSLLTIVWTVVGFFLLAHLISLYSRKDNNNIDDQQQQEAPSSHRLQLLHPPALHQLVRVEEEVLNLPPHPRKRSPRTPGKRRSRKPIPLVDEFLDDKSPIRHLFFPDIKTSSFGPTKHMEDAFHYFPGKIWLDTEGNPIQAHGGGILHDDKSNTYYWYGEYKDGPTYHAHKKGPARVDIIGVGCYSSKDLWTWRNEGIVLRAEETNKTHDLHKSNVLERPKVIYNDKTGKYVMWMHIDDANYTKASVGVAISDTPTGPFVYLYSKRPHGFDSRDMTVFKDDQDGVAYLFYSSEVNSVLHIGPLTEDYLDVTPVMKRVMVGQHREAPAVFKHEGTYYMITSWCTGWAPNEALAHAAESIMGPWEKLGNPCVGGNKVFRLTTFFAQSTYVIPLPGVPGAFIFMADRWNPADLRDSRYVWLPLVIGGPADQPLESSFGFPMWSRVSIYWHSKWRLP
ncbi:Arabinanase/levansucrase/invertase [Raphanus sativus]|uniref:Uncharacterized protein LOC108859545 n=1 Tax=Raphanus sativus TaxID=3726 RepID=A0A6J0NVW7_RAPSA|nr:uncharacterized protein LOC108859545 [Raphanus sativus]KAJ4897142.1 Arabinanase/levansucrase/invertase [Raphanus sativus]